MTDGLLTLMARFDKTPNGSEFWSQKPRYDGASYDLAHLKPLDRTMIGKDGKSIALQFRFGYHCCTDKQGSRALGDRVLEGIRPEEVRYFCPIRWFLSRRLPDLVKSLDRERLARVPGYQWLYTKPIEGISSPWVVWMKVMPGPPGGSMVVGVESAYLASPTPAGESPETFRFIVEQTLRQRALYGAPPSDHK